MNHFKEHIIFYLTVLFLTGFLTGVFIHEVRYNVQESICKTAVVKERIQTTEQIEKGVTKEVTYYLIQCTDSTNDVFRIQTNRDYPLNSHIKKTWVHDGN